MSSENLYTKKLKEVIEFGHEEVAGKKIIEWLTIDGSHLWFYIRFMIFNQVRSSSISNEPIAYKSKSTLSLKIRFLLLFFKRALKGAFSSIPTGKNWLVVNPNAVVPLLSEDGNRNLIGDGYMEYLTQKVLRNPDFVIASEFYPPKFEAGVTHLKTRDFKSAKNEIQLEWFLLKGIMNPSIWKKVKRYAVQLERAIHVIETKSQNSLAKKIRQYKKLMLFSKFRELAFESALTKYRPESITGTNEHDVKLKSLIEPAKRFGIKTIGIQHGIIHKQHIHYIFSKQDGAFKPWPRLTLTWGDQAKKILTETSNYSAENVVTVGQIRTDIIPNLLRRNKDSNYIFFAGQMYHAVDYGYRTLISKDILEYSANHPNEKIVIKPHPRQSNVHGFWKSLEEPGKSYNYEITFDDLYKVISGSKLVITHNSTAGGEAIYFQKPLILTDYSKDDLANFINEKIGKPVYNYNELKEAINNHDEWNLDLKSNRETFIKDRAYKIDGNVTSRIIEIILSS